MGKKNKTQAQNNKKTQTKQQLSKDYEILIMQKEKIEWKKYWYQDTLVSMYIFHVMIPLSR